MPKRQFSGHFSLKLRLLVSHLLVMATALTIVASLAHSYKFYAFQKDLENISIKQEKIAKTQNNIEGVEDFSALSNPILQSFRTVNTTGSLLAVGFGTLCVSALSWVMACYITRPVQEIERAVQDFASGKLDARIPHSSIPEIHRLGVSINNMAMSLQAHEERRRDLMGDLAHDMGTPLTVIQGYLEMIEDKTIQPTSEILGHMHEEALRLNRLRLDVLELSKVESGHLPLNLEKFNPRSILHGIVTNFQGVDTVKQHCRISLMCQANLSDVMADRDRLKQILINLISNAINYTSSGTVVVRAWSEANLLWVAVVDTGMGISPEDLPHVFERFWRADKSRQVTTGGSGIGLALTKSLVERQGGQIKVESELGKGTTFSFCLPSFQTSNYIEPARLTGEKRNAA